MDSTTFLATSTSEKLNSEEELADATCSERAISATEPTPEEFKKFLVDNFNDDMFSTADAIKKFKEYLLSRGFEYPDPPQNYWYNHFYRAIEILKSENMVKRICHSKYYVNSDGVDDPEEVFIENEQAANEEQETNYNPASTLGEGSGEVYLFYYPVYRENALLRGESMWRCKIGMTEAGVEKRIFASSNCRTIAPETPVVGLVIKTDYPSELEQVMHGILTILQKKLSDTPGKEWFLTSPDEVSRIYNSTINAIGNTQVMNLESVWGH